ncbi:MAG: hypothetical protein ABIW84_08290, partial [Ilumatobacteraceae bacterium]
MRNTTQQQEAQTSIGRRKGPAIVGLIGLVGVLSLGVAGTVFTGSAAATTARPTTTNGRVDLTAPTFSNPTEITNPLFPVSTVDQSIQLGAEGDVALRHEITLLDDTRVVRWIGQDIESLVHQFVAYGDGEILE